jgi:Lrp/AsnC family leucine-responsive transcriptional regulator
MTPLDDIDRRILAVLQTNNQITNLELAERVHLSPPTCLRRVRRLREERVIIADVALLDPDKVGRSLFVFVDVMLERQSDALQDAFEARMAGSAEVTQCYMVSGETDFVLVVQVADMKAYHGFVRRVLTGDANVRNFKSRFAMNRSTFRTEVGLE